MERLTHSLRRAALYRIAAEALSYPDAALLASLRERTDQCLAVGRNGERLALALGAFRQALEEASAETLAEEYVRLFDRQVRCPPYETAYGDGRRMAGKPAELADIAGFYTAFGLEPSARHPDMEDHIAAELEFMSLLALKEAAALAGGLDREREVTRGAERLFLSDHLGRWAGTFARHLKAATRLPHYHAAADLLATLVDEEVRACGVRPTPVTERAGPDPLGEDRVACPFDAACGARGAEPDAAAPAPESDQPGRGGS